MSIESSQNNVTSKRKEEQQQQQQQQNIIGKLAAIKLIRPHINETPFNHHAN